MSEMLYIFTTILLPIFIQIGAGYLMQKKFKLDIRTMTRIQIYVLIPAIIFTKIYNASLDMTYVFQVSLFTVTIFVILLIIGEILSRVFKLTNRQSKAFVNGITLRNTGNYGIPLMTLLFAGDELAFSFHMIVLITGMILLNTVGLYYASSGRYSKMEALGKLARMPILYVMVIGALMNGLNIPVPAPLYSTIDIWSKGMVAMALMTLGCQLAETKLGRLTPPMAADILMRLIGSPLIATLLVMVFGIDGVMAKVLIIGAATPTAVNSVLYAIEFQGDSDYASQVVLYTTLLSALTMTMVIKLVM